MTQKAASEILVRDTGHAAPKFFLQWTLDPVTGKPVARWTAEQALTARPTLSAAA